MHKAPVAPILRTCDFSSAVPLAGTQAHTRDDFEAGSSSVMQTG